MELKYICSIETVVGENRAYDASKHDCWHESGIIKLVCQPTRHSSSILLPMLFELV